MSTINNRWMIAVSAMLIQSCLGSVYAWSVFKDPIRAQWGLKAEDEWMLNIAFSLAIGCLGITAAFAGRFQQKIGPMKSVWLSCGLFCGGMLGAAMAISLESIYLLWLSYGIIGGIGLGIGYAPPVMTLVKWFPDKKGLATGLAVGGFGLGAMLAAKVLVPLLQSWSLGPVDSFLYLAGGYAFIMIVCSRWMVLPDATTSPVTTQNSAESIPAKIAFSSRAYRFLWLVFFINISLGIPLIANGKGMAESSGFTSAQAMTIVGIMGLLNGSGRILWSALSDKLGRKATWVVMLALECLIFAALGFGINGMLFAVAVCTIMSTYGGGFAIVPAHVTDLFGSAEASRIYGTLLTAWSAGAMISTPLFDLLKRSCGGEVITQLWLCSGLAVIGILLVMKVCRPKMINENLSCADAK